MREFTVPGKWVLAGEHAVLRGGRAIALPHPHWGMRANADAQPQDSDPELKDALLKLVQSVTGLPAQPELQRLHVWSSLPRGGGLGSSAALCVLAARIAGLTDPAQIRETATRLEDQFHGRSSGMDVAAVVSGLQAGGPILFTPGQTPLHMESSWDLNRFVSFVDTGVRTSTRKAIAHVQEQGLSSVAEGDALMAQAADLAQAALHQPLAAGLEQIARSMALTMEAYRKWGLLPPGTEELLVELKCQGALGARLTGAGLGGFLVALWPHPR